MIRVAARGSVDPAPNRPSQPEWPTGRPTVCCSGMAGMGLEVGGRHNGGITVIAQDATEQVRSCIGVCRSIGLYFRPVYGPKLFGALQYVHLEKHTEQGGTEFVRCMHLEKHPLCWRGLPSPYCHTCTNSVLPP
jgi:hypothetical protein